MLPPKLNIGDTIGIFSPSCPVTAFSPKATQRAIDFIESNGYKVFKGNLTGKQDYYRSGSIAERANELNELIYNPNVKCIMSTIGGMNSNSILPYIDYEQLKKTPKIIIGYSDVTAILFGIYAMTGLTTFYGPALVPSFSDFAPYNELTLEYFKNVVEGKHEYPYLNPTPKMWTDEFVDWETQCRSKIGQTNSLKTLNNGVSEGRFIGGNLDTMQGFWGSKYMPEIKDGDILMIEDSLKDMATAERSFSLLKVNGIFDKIGGLIIGKHERFDCNGSGRNHYDILMEIIGEPSFPILADFDCSHTKPTLTMPIGCRVKLDATNKKVYLLETAVSN